MSDNARASAMKDGHLAMREQPLSRSTSRPVIPGTKQTGEELEEEEGNHTRPKETMTKRPGP